MIKGMLPDPKEAESFFRNRISFTTGPVEVQEMLSRRDEVVIVDVRAGEDFDAGHVPGAVNLPKERWSNGSELNRNAINVFYCYSQVCHLAARAAYKFAALGFPVMEMEGGMAAWREHGFKEEKPGRSPALGKEPPTLHH